MAGDILFENEDVMVLRDIMPKAPVHVQVMPKRHIKSVNELSDEDTNLIGELILAAKNYALKTGISESGFKIVINSGKEGGQVIQHLHMHLLGGKQLEE